MESKKRKRYLWDKYVNPKSLPKERVMEAINVRTGKQFTYTLFKPRKNEENEKTVE